MPLDITVLGPVTLRRDDRTVDLGPAKQRGVFALLVVEANRKVSTGQLEHRLWGDSPPRQPRKTLHSYLTRLRGILADVDGLRLERREGGYVLDVDADTIDLHRFTAFVARARQTGSAREWQRALEQWQGEAFADLDVPWLNRYRHELHAARDQAELERNDAFLRQGRQAELLPELIAQTARRPLDQRLAAQTMETLHAQGRVAEALEHYRELRDRMVAELGHEPGPELRETHRRLLAEQPSRPRVPRQLPADTATFTGRADLVTEAVAALTADPAGPTVITVDGMGGAGKTAFAVRVASTVAEHFPDGQIFVDLHGFSGDPAPLTPSEALGSILRSLGCPGDQIPDDVDGRSALLRTMLAERRIVIVLDNALDEKQLLPLLPGPSPTAVLVTSRRRLTAVDDARPLTVDVLAPDEAARLFATIVGTPGFDPVVDEVVELCGRLPLAIRLAAARLRSRPGWSTTDLRDRLAAERHRLDELRAGSRGVAAAFAVSARDLEPNPRDVFTMLGLMPGSDFTAEAVAALTDRPPHLAVRCLDELVDANLVETRRPGRYRLHDLMRLFARDTADLEKSASDIQDAVRRLRRWYHARAEAAGLAARLNPLAAAESRATPEGNFDGPEAAMSWWDTEIPNLLALLRSESDDLGWRWPLVDCAGNYLLFRSDDTSLTEIAELGLRDAEAVEDPHGQVRMLLRLGSAAQSRWRPQLMLEYTMRALELVAEVDDPFPRFSLLGQLAIAQNLLGRLGEAAAAADEAVADYRAMNGSRGASILITAGTIAYDRGNMHRAMSLYQEALEPYREGDALNHRLLLENLASTCVELGDLDTAEEYLRQAHRLAGRDGSSEADPARLHAQARIELLRGRRERARRFAGQSLTAARANVGRGAESDALAVLASTDLGTEAALADARRAVELAEEAGTLRHLLYSRCVLAEAELATARLDDAEASVRLALEQATEHGLSAAKLLTVLAEIHLARGDRERACRIGEDALARHRRAGHRPGEARTLLLLAEADPSAADGYREAARELHARMGTTPGG